MFKPPCYFFYKKLIIFSLPALFLWSCIKAPEFSNTPTLEFRSFSKPTLKQGIVGSDSVALSLFFTDGDGNFGTPPNGTEKNIFLVDNRTKEVFGQYIAPFVPVEGGGNGISGTIQILILSTCCIYESSSGLDPCERSAEFPVNDLSFDIFISDRAGNKSNVITTPDLQLLCI